MKTPGGGPENNEVDPKLVSLLKGDHFLSQPLGNEMIIDDSIERLRKLLLTPEPSKFGPSAVDLLLRLAKESGTPAFVSLVNDIIEEYRTLTEPSAQETSLKSVKVTSGRNMLLSRLAALSIFVGALTPSNTSTESQTSVKPSQIDFGEPQGTRIEGGESLRSLDALDTLNLSKETKELFNVPTETGFRGLHVDFESLLKHHLEIKIQEYNKEQKVIAERSESGSGKLPSEKLPNEVGVVEVFKDGFKDFVSTTTMNLFDKLGYEKRLSTYIEAVEKGDSPKTTIELKEKFGIAIKDARQHFNNLDLESWRSIPALKGWSDDQLRRIMDLSENNEIVDSLLTPEALVLYMETNLFPSESQENRSALLEFFLEAKAIPFLLALPPKDGYAGSRALTTLSNIEHDPSSSDIQRLVRDVYLSMLISVANVGQPVVDPEPLVDDNGVPKLINKPPAKSPIP